MTGTDEAEKAVVPPPAEDHEDESEDNENNDDDEHHLHHHSHHHYDEEELIDPFGGFGGPPRSVLPGGLQMLGGLLSASSMGSRLREILNNLRQKEDPSMQLIALQELSEILLVSNEDNLSGNFSPDPYVKELVALMQPHEITGEENPEIMLLACRCLANLMEALPASVANVVYGGAVPILCQKLLEISFIDLAEQALSTLEKISVEYPGSIVREGGLTACLSYLEFFATSTQRTAVTTAANCCRNIPDDSFTVVRDVMPILLNVLNSSDQRVVEQASLCVSRIVESFRVHPVKLEELIGVNMLKTILRLLLPGSTSLIGPNIHTQFLRVLAYTASASPQLSAELFKMNVVDTLYQILTGVSPPGEKEDVASKLDSVLIMQALIHRPREQIIETLNVVCNLLPKEAETATSSSADVANPITSVLFGNKRKSSASSVASSSSTSSASSNEKRIELLSGCKDEVRRFALIVFPTLTDAYSSTVNFDVRTRVLAAQKKMLSNLDAAVIIEALRAVPYASFLASILSQQDHPSLVKSALEATELLMSRLDDAYRYQLYREGVIGEIEKLAVMEPGPEERASGSESQDPDSQLRASIGSGDPSSDHDDSDNDDEDEDDGEDDESDDHDGSQHPSEDEDHDAENDHHGDDLSRSPASSEGSTMSIDGPPRRAPSSTPSAAEIAALAKKFLETHETEKHGKAMKKKAAKILSSLSTLATSIEDFYLRRSAANLAPENGVGLFRKLASFFDLDVLDSVTSAELLASGLVRVLEEVFSNPDKDLANAAQSAFLEMFMGHTVKTRPKTSAPDSPATPFSVLMHKLQDLLSRSEHFDVLTVHHNAHEGNRSSAASMLAKQIRLRLVAEDEDDIPRSYRSVMVSMHAIATFKVLDDYLRPRISLTERTRGSRREGFSRAIAAVANSAGVPLSAVAARLAERPPPPATGSIPAPPAIPSQPSSSRSSRKSKPRSGVQAESSTPDPASASREKAVLRRSSRRHTASASTPPPPRPPPEEEDDLANALECADEKQLEDDDDDELGQSSALDAAIVGDLDEDMDDAPTPEPSAVNLEVAAGGKITARKDDGTRVPTPSQRFAGVALSRAAALAAALQNSPTPPSSSRPISYAAAIQAVPQDWYIEFSLNSKVIPNEMTVYRAIHNSAVLADEHSHRGLWMAVHTIKFRRVRGPPPTESISLAPSDAGAESADGAIPGSLANTPTTASILRLLKILHDLNANIDDVLVENKQALRLNIEPLSQFVNTKLTAKLNRQLEEPLIVASNCLPSWSEDLARLYPFIFPFETRHLFLQSTSFGYARSMARWQNAQSHEESRRSRHDERPVLGRIQRQKVRISRSKILESAIKVIELYGASQSMLEVEYFEEVGTGLGPTLEFYSTVSKEFSKKKLRLWRDADPNDSDEFVSIPNGLFPRPLSEEDATGTNGERIMGLFKTLGKFVARSMLDSRIIDISFNPIFFRIGDESSGVRPSLGAVKIVDPGLARSLMLIKKFAIMKKEIDENPHRSPAQKVADTQNITINNTRVEDLSLDFTLPGYPEIELIAGGSQVNVTIENIDLYLEKVIDMTLGTGVHRQVDAFRKGFSKVFPYSALSAFTPDELVTLFGRVDEDWSLESMSSRSPPAFSAHLFLALPRSIFYPPHGFVFLTVRSAHGLGQGGPRLQYGQPERQESPADDERARSGRAPRIPAVHYGKPQAPDWR